MAKTILITGASSGIGRATALYFQKKGWNVIASMRSPEKETELVNLTNTICPRLDVTDRNTITAAINDGVKKFGSIDVIVNNAGYGLVGEFINASEEEIERQFSVNVFGVMSLMNAIIPTLKNMAGALS